MADENQGADRPDADRLQSSGMLSGMLASVASQMPGPLTASLGFIGLMLWYFELSTVWSVLKTVILMCIDLTIYTIVYKFGDSFNYRKIAWWQGLYFLIPRVLIFLVQTYLSRFAMLWHWSQWSSLPEALYTIFNVRSARQKAINFGPRHLWKLIFFLANGNQTISTVSDFSRGLVEKFWISAKAGFLDKSRHRKTWRSLSHQLRKLEEGFCERHSFILNSSQDQEEMPSFDIQTQIETLIQNILPSLLSSPVVCAIIIIMTTGTVLRCIFLPCITLQGLQDTIETAEKLLEGHVDSIQTTISNNECEHCMELLPRLYERKKNLRRIRKVMNKIYSQDRNAPWFAYLSLTRICMISSSYKILCISRKDIEDLFLHYIDKLYTAYHYDELQLSQ
ncbi:hypothetical protein BDP27DRAFT_1374312 [Rhodocollybia butyracea]|uniref:Uncharacterized protein n=1 Tax=Rhodocollybia butyracea TaxID=206335 RepID=A0A9P5P6V0_9AGAR|nr:hypothetical protein BDP27DRAFT_1374312 [Rhodocollybia butyracea]